MLGFSELKELEDLVIEWNLIARDEHPTIQQQVMIVQEELEEYNKAIAEGDLKEELDAVADIFFTAAYLDYLDPSNRLVGHAIRVLTVAIANYGLPLVKDIIQEVIESNYTKFLLIGEDPEEYPCWVPEEVRNDIEDFLGIEGVTFKSRKLSEGSKNYFSSENSSGHVYVFYNKNNKVMKPRWNYKPPNIEGIMFKHSLGLEV
jgi:hypothetical protein